MFPYFKTALAAAGLMMAAQAAHAEIFDFRSGQGGTLNHGGYGNVLTVVENGKTVRVSGWYEGSGDTLTEGQLRQWTAGLGLCSNGAGDGNCGNPQHHFDNNGVDEWALILFDEVVTIDSITVRPYGAYDTDVQYFVGTRGSTGTWDLSGITSEIAGLASLGASVNGEFFDDGPLGIIHTVDINQVGDFLLIGPNEFHSNDYFKLKKVSATYNVVPEPAAWSLMISGFAGLGFAMRRRKAAAKSAV